MADNATYGRLRGRLRERRETRLLDQYDDARYYLDEWGFGMTPSERRKAQVKVDRLAAKTACLRFHRGERCVPGRNHPGVPNA